MNLKQMVGIEAAKKVQNGMVIGLGTGSTAFYMVEEIGRRIKEEGLFITAVTTSYQTQKHAEKLGIPLKSIDEVDKIDLTIDGADEIDKNMQGIKGGGAALLFEKIVATNSNRNIWIVDSTKMVEHLGDFPLPIEVIPYGSQKLFNKFKALNMSPEFRFADDGSKLLTDANHYIIDCHLKQILNPIELGAQLDKTVGIVEHGLFVNIADEVIIGYPEGPKTIVNKNKEDGRIG